jgi:hypothetical protein
MCPCLWCSRALQPAPIFTPNSFRGLHRGGASLPVVVGLVLVAQAPLPVIQLPADCRLPTADRRLPTPRISGPNPFRASPLPPLNPEP